jgi:hypothetical protein
MLGRMALEKLGGDLHVVVGDDEDVPARDTYASVSRRSSARVYLLQNPKTEGRDEVLEDLSRGRPGAVVHDDDFELCGW